jgi:hypothetical protein
MKRSSEDIAEIVPFSPAGRAAIRCEGGELPRMVDEAEEALIREAPHVYSRGSLLVTPAMACLPASDGRQLQSPRLKVVSAVWLVEALTRIVGFQRFTQKRGLVPIDCPMKVAQTLLEREHWRLPPLSGVLSTPTLRGDGSVLQAEGYDARSSLVLDFRGAAFPQIPEAPHHGDAKAALDNLLESFVTFDSVADVDRAVIVSAVMTALVRRSLPTAPLHAVTAHTAGSGKSMLVDLVALIATGRVCPVVAGGQSSEELEKRLGAAFLHGDAILSLDNLDHPLASDFLAQALTQQAVKVRVLGRSKLYEVPTGAMLLATGNNLRIAGDLTRRCLVVRLDPDHEQPELRQFSRDARAYVVSHRGQLVKAALTIIRAYACAGRPAPLPPLGSFEDWSAMVREAVVWAGGADPVLSLETARAGDPERESLRIVMWAWAQTFQGQRIGVAEAILESQRKPDLKDALLTAAAERGEVSPRRLGKWMAKIAGRRLEGARFVQDGQRRGSALWKLEGFGGFEELSSG